MATLTSSLIVRLIDQVTGPAKKIGSSLLGLNRVAGGNFGDNLNQAIDRNNQALATARGGLFDAAAAFYALKTAISSPVRAAMNFESAMADVRKVVDFPTPKAFTDFQAELIALSKTVPLSVNGLAQIAAAAGQAGIAGDDLVKFTRSAAKIGTAFDISADAAGDAMAKMITGLGITIDEAVLLADAMNHLSNAQASSASDILDVVRRVGAQAKLYGFTAEQTAAFASAMISAGAESEVAATSFRNMGMALTRGASATKRQNGAFKKLGMSAKQVAADMQKDAVGTTIRVLEEIAKLPKEVQGAVSSDLFGNEARALGPLLTNLQLVKDSMALVAKESDYAGSAFREFEVRAKTFANATEVFSNRFTALKIVIGSALIPAINDLMGALGPLIDRFSSFAAAHPELIANITKAVAALIAFKIASASLRFIGLLGRGGALSLMSIGFNTVGKAAIAARAAITGTLALQTALAGGASYSGLAKMADAAGALVRITPGLNLVGPAFGAIGAGLATLTAPIVAGIAAVAATGFLIYKYWGRISAVFAGVGRAIGEQLAPALELARPVLDWLAPVGEKIAAGWSAASSAISDFGSWIGSFFSQEIISADQKASFERSGYEMATAFIENIKTGFSGLWIAVRAVINPAGVLDEFLPGWQQMGANLAQSMVDGVKAKIDELVAWFAGLPGRIMAAIGRIDIGSLIKWPSMPSWLGGGGAANDNPAPKTVTGHRKAGGPVWPSGSFLVGEEEPEIFSPKTAGTITPVSDAAGGGASAPAAPAPASLTMRVGQIGPFTISGASDPAETARQVARGVETSLNDLIRAAHADMGARS